MARAWTIATALLGPLGCCLRDAASSPVAATLSGSPGVELGRTLLACVRAGSEGTRRQDLI